MLSNNSIKII